MNEGPKEGVYLDAVLAVIGEQIDERIDALSRRKRVHVRIGIAALTVVTLASASAAAYALSTVASSPGAAVASSPGAAVAGEIRCIDGSDPHAAAYFTAAYGVSEKERVDAVALCARARGAIAAAPERYLHVTPAQAVASAAALIETDTVMVDRASFGTVGLAGAWHGVCRDGDADVVMSSTTPLSSSAWAARCAAAGFTGAAR